MKKKHPILSALLALLCLAVLTLCGTGVVIMHGASKDDGVRNPTLAPQLGKTHRHREIGDFFSCLTWRAIPGLFSKLHRRLYSL